MNLLLREFTLQIVLLSLVPGDIFSDLQLGGVLGIFVNSALLTRLTVVQQGPMKNIK